MSSNTALTIITCAILIVTYVCAYVRMYAYVHTYVCMYTYHMYIQMHHIHTDIRIKNICTYIPYAHLVLPSTIIAHTHTQ